jgi:polar amino acid transport system permease protein
MDFSTVSDNLHFLVTGLRTTVLLAVIAAAGSCVIGLAAALGRLYGGRVVEGGVKLYIDLFRSTPLLIQLIWCYFALPVVVGASLSPFAAAAIALSLYHGAFFTEIFRAGILSIARGQGEAGLALGMTGVQAYRRIVLPQSMVGMLPVICQQLVILLKDTSLASVITVTELTWRAQNIGTQTLDPVPVLTMALITYMLLCYPITAVGNVAYRRLRS